MMRTSTLVRHAPLLAVIGGTWWAVLPASSLIPWPDIFGLLTYVLPVAIIALALVGLHQRHAPVYGRRGRVGAGITLLGLALVGVGNAVEVVSVALIDEENAFGHLMFFVGYLLVVLPGAVLLGLAVRGASLFPGAGMVGIVLVLVLPLSIVLGLLASLVAPPSGDIAFWVAMATGYGIAWVMLGVGLRSEQAPARDGGAMAGAT